MKKRAHSFPSQSQFSLADDKFSTPSFLISIIEHGVVVCKQKEGEEDFLLNPLPPYSEDVSLLKAMLFPDHMRKRIVREQCHETEVFP
ncbi:hypothetical protein TNIN_413371 [Trichonephila inaurata madagascariensis]|uniref:Uncharacterized protein n=1 Tax=Trichonephila inaurata madagascariensis TaxID=2747483 RepID=A0A8X6X5X7_9ARAC|nr:hypothetical protein TNIN_413371 [Trichonephila inaurata madagascariensis]